MKSSNNVDPEILAFINFNESVNKAILVLLILALSFY